MKTLAVFILLSAASLAYAQDPTPAVSAALADYNRSPGAETASQLIEALIQAAMEGKPAAAPAAASPELELNEGRRLALNLLANRQDGAPAGVGSGTSLVSLKSVTDLISGALDSGAFSKTTQGTVATFRANVIGASRLFSGDCPSGSVQHYPACITEDTSAWRGLSIALSFDSSREDQVSPSLPANPSGSIGAVLLRAQKGLSAANIRYDFYRPRDQKSQAFATAWKSGIKDLRTKAGDYATALGEGPSSLTTEAIKEGRPAQLNALLAGLPAAQRLGAAQNFVATFLAAPGHQVAADKRNAYVAARKEFLKNEVKFFQNTLDRKLFTLEFTDQRPKDEPEYGSVRIISSLTAGTHKDEQSDVEVPDWEITFNAAADFYYDSKILQKDRRLRDFQVALQADHKLWRWSFLSQPTFTLAGYYQRLTDDLVIQFSSDAITPGTGIPLPKPANVILRGTKGDVGIAQAKLTIPLGSSGVSFPLAVSWSNRTEFLKVPGNDVRGHFGFQFDLDKLLSSFKK